jgi:hypothetical protein
MSTEATQGMGADVADLESMFSDEGVDSDGQQTAADAQLDAVAQAQSGADTQTQQTGEDEVIVDENGDPVVEVELDENGNEIIVDPNANGENVELVVPDDHKVKLTVDGKEVEFSFGELKAGAQKYEAANKRFEEAAAIRKEYTEKAQTLGTREQQLGQVLQYYIEQSQQFMAKEPDWAGLLQNDPQKYLVEKHNWEQRQMALAQARQVQQNVQRQQAEQQMASVQQRVGEAKQKLLTAIPEWTDPQKAADGALAIDKYLHEQGIAPEMRKAIDSAEVLLVARKAMLYDQAVAAAKARKGAKVAPTQGQQQQVVQGQRQQQRQQQGRVERVGAATAAQTAASRQNLSRANAAKAFNANPSVDTLAEFFQ